MNQTLLALIFAFLGSQGFKVVYNVHKRKSFSWHDIFETGGMPSSHSALVMTLVTSIYLLEGFTSAFFIAVILAFIVIRDATGVRYSAGLQGQFLTKLLKKHKIKKQAPHFALGHTPMQAFVGSCVGIVATIISTII
ncbi:hypothetical protein CL619_04955 [archaeon]|nr:hypothetical protein [archaeon]|tara:strand:+ start:1999 stop:2409 length:411 start_codon:yes stop_codon:yes gene_type:complete